MIIYRLHKKTAEGESKGFKHFDTYRDLLMELNATDRTEKIEVKASPNKNELLNLLNQYASHASKSPWISTDILPEVGEYYLVIVNTDIVLKAKLCHDGWMIFYSDGQKAAEFSEVTHYMVLPTAPRLKETIS